MNIILGHSYGQLSTKAASFLIQEIKSTISKKGKAVLALPGGRSVAGLLQKLSLTDLDWSKVEIFMVDERVVPVDSKESNYKQAYDLFLHKVKAKSHPFDMRKSVDDYNQEFGQAGGHFDIIILGVGEDGHIAALFPGHPALKVRGKKYIQLDDSPKLPLERITASPDVIKDAEVIILLFAGKEKKKAYDQFSNSEIEINKCPAKIALQAKKLYVLTEFS